MSNVLNPKHYGGKDDPYEAIKVMRARLTPQEYVGALKFNIYTYNDRAVHKNGVEDFEKAGWYQAELIRYTREVGLEVIYPPSLEESILRDMETTTQQTTGHGMQRSDNAEK